MMPLSSQPATETTTPPDQYLIIDRELQLTVLRRVAAYGLIALLYIAAISLATTSMADPEFNWQAIWIKYCDEALYWAPGLLVILPTLAIDLLRLTRRFASPVAQLREEFKLLAEGRSESPLDCDPDAPWHGLISEFNELRQELLDLRQASILSGGRFAPLRPQPGLREPMAAIRPLPGSPPLRAAGSDRCIDASADELVASRPMVSRAAAVSVAEPPPGAGETKRSGSLVRSMMRGAD